MSPLTRLRACAPLVALCLLVTVRAAEPAAAEPAPRTLAELQARLERHVNQPRQGGALWGVKIASLDTGRVWFEHHADRLLSPASNTKLYTGALALDRLGGDYRIVTPIYGTAKPGADGVLRGDLVVAGRGDPSWRTRGTARTWADLFAPVVTMLRTAGIRRVTGDVVADATWIRGVPHGAGWTADDLNDDYGAEISALSLEDNYVEIRVTPGPREGAPAELALVEPHTGLSLDNRVRTVAKGAPRRLEVTRLLGENVVHVFGEMPLGEKPATTEATVPKPAAWLAAALKAELVRAGIAVDGAARAVRWPDPAPDLTAATKLGEITSAPLRELVAGFMKPSQNLETCLIFAHVGEATRTPETPVRRTSEELGVAALQTFLKKHGLPADDVRFEEGSGLSRNNLTTAQATVALLTFMAKHAEAAAYAAALPVAGVDGTLRRRMKGTPAEGKVQAKTGTLRYANSLSGYVTTAGGERLVFALMLNRSIPVLGRPVRDDLDEVAALLAGFTGRGTAQVDLPHAPPHRPSMVATD